jgi:hypothetical protein
MGAGVQELTGDTFHIQTTSRKDVVKMIADLFQIDGRALIEETMMTR